tara:strand:+ start:28039 stop:28821 length:783 start_codon:yes stop_codon:yes gene_type:complete
MKIVIDGKELSEKLKAVLLKGKWNQGTEARASSLGSAVIIQVVENEVYLYNGNESTYVKIRLDDVEVLEQGRCCVSYDLLNKYLKTGNCILEVLEEEGMLQLFTNNREIKLPLLDRHPNNDQILYSKENYIVNYREAIDSITQDKGLPISSKTNLDSVMLINTETFVNAIKSCEVVGIGVYKLEYDNGVLVVSSTKNRESVKVTVGVNEFTGPIATVEFTGPLHTVLDTDEFIIAFNDDSPISVLSSNVQILRAPRVVDE